VRAPAELELAVERYGQGVVEELVVGEEHTMDCWVDDAGTCACVVPRQRLATRAGEIAKGVTVRHRALESQVAAIVEALPGARGPMTVQAIVSADGPRYIEINPRFGGGYPLSHQAGARYTAALAAEALGKPVDPAWFAWRHDLVMLRYDEAVFLPRSAVDTVS
jgi:carbamoyl-phosphate synthase large subunit